MPPIELAIALLPVDLAATVATAVAAEAAGFGWVGIADSPVLYHDPYLAAAEIARATRTVRVGPCVTNGVTRHWSVAAGLLRTLDSIAPGRAFTAIAAGDSAVHSVGLPAARPAELARYVTNLRAAVPHGLPILVAAGGRRAAHAAAAAADALILGQGLSVVATSSLAAASTDGSPGRTLPLWLFASLDVVPDDRLVPEARRAVRAGVMGFARQAFDHTLDGKDIPEDLQPILKALFERYDFTEHAVPGESANARLLDEAAFRVAGDWLIERFALVGTADAVARRLLAFRKATGVDRAMFFLSPRDPQSALHLIGERLVPALRATDQAAGRTM